MPLPVISIVVTTYNSSKTLDECLISLNNLDFPKDVYEIIVIDGGSADDTLIMLSKYPSIRLFKNIKCRGNAYNVGINVAYGEYVAFVDSDAAVFPTFLTKLMGVFSNNQIAYVSGRVHGPTKSKLIQKFADVLQSRSIGSACACIYQKKAVIEVGGFNPSLHYYQEDELLKRLNDNGYLNTNINEFIACHIPKDSVGAHMLTSYIQGYWASIMLFYYSFKDFIRTVGSNIAGTLFFIIFLLLFFKGTPLNILMLFIILIFSIEGLYLSIDTWQAVKKPWYIFGAILLYHLCSLAFSMGVLKKIFIIISNDIKGLYH